MKSSGENDEIGGLRLLVENLEDLNLECASAFHAELTCLPGKQNEIRSQAF